jgi:hypothetical protein
MNAIMLTLALAPGQYAINPPDQVKTEPKAATSAEVRKDARDKVLQVIPGPETLAFTKFYGDLGVSALQQCGPESGRALVRLFGSGDLARLKNPKAALVAIRTHGALAATWLTEHFEQLVDPEALECWVKEPMEYVFELKDIEHQAAQLKASRRVVPPWASNLMANEHTGYVVFGGLVIALVVIVVRRRRAPQPANP